MSHAPGLSIFNSQLTDHLQRELTPVVCTRKRTLLTTVPALTLNLNGLLHRRVFLNRLFHITRVPP